MKRLAFIAIIALGISAPANAQQQQPLAHAYANLPMNFEQNVGQTDGQAQFISHGKGYTLFLSPDQAIFEFHAVTFPVTDKLNEKKLGKRLFAERAMKSTGKTEVVRMKLKGANPGARIVGVDRISGSANYFVGSDPSKWRTSVPLFARVQSSEVLPGIDLVYYGNEKRLEYDFVVKPGGDPNSISLGFDGIKNTLIDGSGNLSMATETGGMKLNKPVIYQMIGGHRKEITGKYTLRGENTVGVNVTGYDKTQPLIIDPVLVYSTYLGGSGDDGIYDIAVDLSGNTYVVGWTDSTNFPIVGTSLTPAPSGTQVAFVTKFNSTGTALVYSTYLGGTGGEWGSGIALDANGSAYVVGQTGSSNFPVTSDAYQASFGSGASQNAFVSKLSADGQSLLYSTYLGGGGYDQGIGIAVDANQNAYVTGYTSSGSPNPFPTTANAFQSTLKSSYGNGFIARIDTTKSGSSSLVYSTFLGGSGNWDQTNGIAVDAHQNVYVGGMTSSSDFPLTPTAYQTVVDTYNGTGFLTQIDTTKSGSAGLIYSTVIEGETYAAGVALDANGKVYATAGYVAKFDTTKSGAASLLYFTRVGGSSNAFTYSVAVDPNGDAYVAGWTSSTDLTVTSDAIQAALGSGGQNSFITVLRPDGSTVLFGTYLGGNGGANDFASGIAVDQNYNIYVAGATQSSNFETTSGVFQTTLDGASDAFVAKFSPLNVPIVTSISPTTGIDGAAVTINGENFGSSQGNSTVSFANGVTAQVMNWTATSISVTVPSGATTGSVIVIVSGNPSNGANFSVLPNIASLSPSIGFPGTPITITGAGFGATQSASVVTLNGTLISPSSWSDTQIVVAIPLGASSGNAAVTTLGGASNEVPFTVIYPTITALSEPSGTIGMTVTITGSNFGATQGSSTVTFNGTAAIPTSWSSTSISAAVPSLATSGNIVVTVGGVASNGLPFTVTPGTGPGFTTTNNLNTARGGQTATLLNNGQVLLAGGADNNYVDTLATAELYDPSTTTFLQTGSLNTPRIYNAASLLNNGSVLISGGQNRAAVALGSAELYESAIGAFVATGNMSAPRTFHTATVLKNGMVLVAGGIDANNNSLPSAELYDPASGTFAITGSLNTARNSQTATLLNNGMVLIAGGIDANNNALASAELYDPTSGTFTVTGSLNTARSIQTATLLNNGLVLVAEGFDTNFNFISTAELYDPTAGTFAYTGSPIVAREGYTATLLNNGMVLFAGGYDSSFNNLSNAEMYDPTSGTFSTASSSLSNAPYLQTATLLPNGLILIAGGFNSSNIALSGVELYTPNTMTPAGLVSIALSPVNPAIPLATAQPFTVVGTFSNGSTQTLASVTWSSSSNSIATITDDLTNYGHVFAVQPGSATVTGCAGSVCGSTVINVSPSTLASISVAPANGTILMGSSLQLQATGLFTDGGIEDLTRSVTWTSSVTAVATINPAGLASAIVTGSTTITATSGSTTATATLTVVPPLVSIIIAPRNPSLPQSNTLQFTATGTYGDGSTKDLTSATNWSSSAPATVSINSAGLATGVAQGTTTIAGDSGGFSSFTIVNVTPPLPVSIAMSPQNYSLPLGLTEQFTVTGTYADGSTQDLTAVATWTSLNSTAATVGSGGVATSHTVGNTLITATYGTTSASSPLAVTPPTLLLVTVNPQSIFLPQGITQQFTALGTYSDGSTQDASGLVVWSSSNATTATINASGRVTPVAAGSTLITAAANGLTFSTGLAVTAAGPPTITASVSPTPNTAGWNNSNVTVTFTCIPGGVVISICPPPQMVTSEGAGQVVSGTVSDGLGNSATTSVTLNIDETPPALAVASPTDAAVFTNSALTVTGNVSDALSGIAALTCNQMPVTFSGGTFSCNISLNPGVNLIVVSATDIAGNISLTKMHVTLNVSFPSPISLSITPGRVNLVEGQVQQFSVVDELGRPRPDATWTVSNTFIATITTDASPLLTALSVGQVTLAATVQGRSIQAQVNILGVSITPGTMSWRVPPLPDFNIAQTVQAVPTSGGPDIYSIEGSGNGAPSSSVYVTIRALTADGREMWRQALGLQNAVGTFAVPDAFGGLIVQSMPFNSTDGVAVQPFLMDLDGQTGAPVWRQNFLGNGYLAETSRSGYADLAIRANGDIIIPGEDQIAGHNAVWVINGQTGQRTPLPFHPYTLSGNCFTGQTIGEYVPSESPNPSSDADGNTYLEYMSIDQMTSTCEAGIETDVWTSTLRLLTLSASSSISEQTIKSRTDVFGGGRPFFPLLAGSVIPDGQGGVIATWTEGSGFPATTLNAPIKVTHIGQNGSATYELPIGWNVDPALGGNVRDQLVLGENGVAFATNGHIVVAGDANTGQPNWNYQTLSQGTVSIAEASSGGGVTIDDSTQGVVQLDPYGNISGRAAYLEGDSPFSMSSWLGISYGELVQISSPNGSNGILNTVAASVSPSPGGDPQGQHEPPLCQRADSYCAIVPIVDSHTTGSFPQRDITYGVFSLQSQNLKRSLSHQISLREELLSGSAAACLAGDLHTDCDNRDQITDQLAAQFTTGSTVRQKFFVDRTQVKVYWPYPSSGEWFGAYSQLATTSNSYASGAHITQETPDSSGVTCSSGCSKRETDGTTDLP